MRFNSEQIKKVEQEVISYQDVYYTIRNVEVISDSENRDWLIEDLKNQLVETFRLTGEVALEENNGIICTTLSGGLDSTLALSLLRKNFPGAKIITFTMGGDENHPDIKYARLAAKKFNAKNIEIIPSPIEIQETLGEYQKKFPERQLKEAVEKGDFDVYLLYKNIYLYHPESLIVHDGIDELMGGYWNHCKDISLNERKKFFTYYWNRLIPDHLDPLIKTSQNFNIKLLFPYLDEKLIGLISKIPVEDRASGGIGKKPLREIARQFEVPKEIINRTKRGQVGMTEIEELRDQMGDD